MIAVAEILRPSALPRVRLKAPSDTLDRLIALGLASVERATARLAVAGSPETWRREMERMLATAYQAAFIAATAERLGVPPDSPLISRARLSRVERETIKRAIAEQIQFLEGFVRDIREGDLSQRAIQARANMYARSIRAFYYAQRWGDWEIPDNLIPGNQQCLSNCRCTLLDIRDNGDGTGVLTRVMGATELHCTECPPLAGDHVVTRRRRT